ncbi:hypothetical protein NCC49_005320 [Naganishia albida]|nr:hypothetical protein NCC49_005320 [Naganishia albida]
MAVQPQASYPEGVNPPTLQGVHAAYNRIKSHIHRTPLLTSTALNGLASKAVQDAETVTGQPLQLSIGLKAENLQRIGAFKTRGAMNAVLRYLEEEPADQKSVELNVVTHSSGNFAQALALAAHHLTSPDKSIKATIIMATTGSPAKRAGVVGYGARIVDCNPDNRVEVCEEEIRRMQLEGKKVAYFPSYDHVDIIEGQGTCMVEVEEQAQEVWGVRARPDIVVCPIGGGGLMSGVSIASKGYWGKPGIKVVGAEPASANDTHGGFYGKTWLPALPPGSVCDGLLTATGNITYPALLANVDDILLAEDDSTIRAMKFIWERMKIIIEPSSALALATILGNTLGGSEDSAEWKRIVREVVHARHERGEPEPEKLKVVIVISGGNVVLTQVLRMFEKLESESRQIV